MMQRKTAKGRQNQLPGCLKGGMGLLAGPGCGPPVGRHPTLTENGQRLTLNVSRLTPKEEIH